MKILDRYIGKAVLTTSIFAVAVLTLVLVLGNIFKMLDMLLNRNVPLEFIASFIFFILVGSLSLTIPWGFLTAILLVFGRLSAENELIAFRSNGVSITRMCASVAAIGVGFALICLWINVDVAPRAQASTKNVVLKIALDNPIAMFSSDQVIDQIPGRKIYVEKIEGNNLFNILVYEQGDREEPMRVIHAQSGELFTDVEHKQILMKLTGARFEQRDSAAPDDLALIRQGITMRKLTFPVSLKTLYEKKSKRRGPDQKSLAELLDKTDEDQITQTRTEINKRFSFSFAAIAFALIGVPLAMTAQRKETSIGFLISMIVAFVYYFFIIFASGLRDNPKVHPELLMWVPNVVFITLGAWMFYRQTKK